MFEQADVNHDGTLSMKEIQKLLKRLNINFSNREIKKRFKVRTYVRTYLHMFPCIYISTSICT